MASELKPWRYEIKYGPEGEDAYSWVYDDHGAMVATMKTHKAKQIVDAMNTRPAPAATDTGLVTVAWRERAPTNNYFTYHEYPTPLVREKEELVTRSQAVELLAAKDQLIQSLNIVVDNFKSRTNALKADNAALTARVKELEADVKREARSSTHNAQDCLDEQLRAEALEAKLAAAEKALTEIASFTQTTDLLWWQERARAALGGKPL